MKKIFKFRQFRWKWFTFYLFPRYRYDISIGMDLSEGDYPLFFISLLVIGFDITFAPNSWFNPSIEEKERIDKIMNLSEKEKHQLAMENIMKRHGITTSK